MIDDDEAKAAVEPADPWVDALLFKTVDYYAAVAVILLGLWLGRG